MAFCPSLFVSLDRTFEQMKHGVLLDRVRRWGDDTDAQRIRDTDETWALI